MSYELNRLLLNLIRKGTVIAVDHAAEKCRVATGDLETNWIRWISLAAGTTLDWNPPTVDEQVLVLCPGGDPAEAVVLRGLNSPAAPAPSHSPDTHTRKYPDGAVIEYDHVQHTLTVTLPADGEVVLIAPGSVTVKAETVTVDALQATFTGELTVQKKLTYQGGMTGSGGANIEGNIQASGDVKAGNISTINHIHMEQGDGKPVGKPQ